MKGILGVRNEALVKKSIVLSLAEPNIKIRVMHPYTIWLSRLENLISIKEKERLMVLRKQILVWRF